MYLKMIVPFFAVILAVATAGLVGAPVDAEMDEEAQNALQFAMVQYNRQNNDAFVHQVSEVIKVQKQVVSGLKYIFTVNVARTNCRKGGVQTLCAIQLDSAPATQCKITVWSQPWLKSIKVLENSCM